ncbi:AAA family ATPase [Pseudaestuariivita atlantica]|uniref:AAA family ATPase n=1 Tax=Pseudaestuariivita atlantica TaxID=1317121 RepID=UPI000AE70D31|nr:AAA family ATPase [Pseudaestuariivita atlantica]
MKDENEFKAWLEQGGAQTEAGRNSRTYAVRTIERNLATLGMPYQNLEEAWEVDQFSGLRERLKAMRNDARSGGEDYRILMPDSEKPHNRLSNWSSWLAQYGRFIAGEPPGAAKDADRIRQHVLEQYIEPAREEGASHVDVLVRDVNTALNLNEAWPNICQALAGKIFQDLAQVSAPERIGADQSSATVFRFSLETTSVNLSALEKLRRRFLDLCPDFETFESPGEGWAKGEKAYKLAAIERVQEAIATDTQDETLGKSVFEILKTAAKDGPFVRWQTEDAITKNAPDTSEDFYATIGRLLRTDEPAAIALDKAYDSFVELRERGATSLTYGERLNIVFSSLAMVRPTEAAPLKITRINEAWEELTGEKLFVESTANMRVDYGRFARVFAELFTIMRDTWAWRPQDWLDIQGFLWIALDKTTQKPFSNDPDVAGGQMTEGARNMLPENLILFGPPGTGKTYRTAAEAVRLCGEEVPEDRDDLMAVYQGLLAAGRIEFVTFHQSMAYEEFVEGRQPMTGADDGEDTSSAGFRLQTVPGIFRRIAKRAETSRGHASDEEMVRVEGRQVFKMSIGEANNPEDAHLFEEAIKGGYALLGFEDIDWSDDKFGNREAIIEACKAHGDQNGNVDARSGVVQMPFIFRNWVRDGDIVIVSKGNGLFRAIGEFTGGYEFAPRPEGGYAHRRAVRWLWVDREGVPVDEIYSRKFSQKSIYALYDAELNVPALERYMNSQQNEGPSEPEPFVLIIDEINRANISKVFGELITLLEPDKRLGQPNHLKVRLPYSGDEFGVPSNLHIVGTMNTADRSIALLDTALRRRFTFREIMPNPAILKEAAARTGIDLPTLLKIINERIEYLYDRDHQIGHGYFTGCDTRADVDEVMRHKVIPLLAEYFFEDWGKIAAVLGDLETHDGPIEGGFLNRSVLTAPPGLDNGEAMPRFRWDVREDSFDYARLLGS